VVKMTVKLVVAVTDSDWFNQLGSATNLDEVNFWSPSPSNFRALQPGELLLFKLHAPKNYIVGGGVFAYATALPTSLAWEAFGTKNGAQTLVEMRTRIAKYRRISSEERADFDIGCRILTQPFFLEEAEWVPVPSSWSSNIVSFKTYSTEEGDGRSLWELLEARTRTTATASILAQEPARFGKPVLVRPRLGQGAFRVLVTDSYQRRCAVTTERTLPALDAAHIRPYAVGGSHEASNGLLLRRDLHSLFDAGYVTVTPEMRFEVSRRIREEFQNGKHYYALHGQTINVPDHVGRRPERAALAWHNENSFLG
jgi:putative restriction endonuclease